MKSLINQALFYVFIFSVVTVGNWTATAEAQNGVLACETVTQITNNGTRDLWPDWEPGGERITFNTFGTDFNVPRDIGMVNSDGTGYNPVYGDLPTCPWGTFFPRWGPGGTILSSEHNTFHEYLSFNAVAPFNKTTCDGSQGPFTRKLLVSGGGGGGWMLSSADGSTVLWRWSTSGGVGTQQIRRGGPLASLTGQAANSVGTVIQQTFSSSVQFWGGPIALSPNGSFYINVERTLTVPQTNLAPRAAR